METDGPFAAGKESNDSELRCAQPTNFPRIHVGEHYHDHISTNKTKTFTWAQSTISILPGADRVYTRSVNVDIRYFSGAIVIFDWYRLDQVNPNKNNSTNL